MLRYEQEHRELVNRKARMGGIQAITAPVQMFLFNAKEVRRKSIKNISTEVR